MTSQNANRPLPSESRAKRSISDQSPSWSLRRRIAEVGAEDLGPDDSEEGRRLYRGLAARPRTVDRPLPRRIPEGSRASREGPLLLTGDMLTGATLAKVRALQQVTTPCGQTLAQMALVGTLRDPESRRPWSAPAALLNWRTKSVRSATSSFDDDELAEMDR